MAIIFTVYTVVLLTKISRIYRLKERKQKGCFFYFLHYKCSNSYSFIYSDWPGNSLSEALDHLQKITEKVQAGTGEGRKISLLNNPSSY